MTKKGWRRKGTQLTRCALGHWSDDEVLYKPRCNFRVTIRREPANIICSLSTKDANSMPCHLGYDRREMSDAIIFYPDSVKTEMQSIETCNKSGVGCRLNMWPD